MTEMLFQHFAKWPKLMNSCNFKDKKLLLPAAPEEQSGDQQGN